MVWEYTPDYVGDESYSFIWFGPKLTGIILVKNLSYNLKFYQSEQFWYIKLEWSAYGSYNLNSPFFLIVYTRYHCYVVHITVLGF